MTEDREIIRLSGDQPETGSARIAAANAQGVEGLLGLAVAVVVVAGLFFAKDVLIPITLAILLSFVLSPIVSLLRRLRLPKALAVLTTVIAALGMIGGLGTLVGFQAASLSADAPKYAQTIEAKIDGVKVYAAEKMAFLTKTPARATPAAPTLTPGTRAAVPVRVLENEPSVLDTALGVLKPVLAPFETFVIVLVVAIFILMQKEDLRDRLIRLFGSSDLHRTTVAMDDAASRLGRYFLSQLAVNASFGIVVGLGLWWIGLPVPALWGILAGILRFVPYIGSLLAAALPLALAAGIDPGWSMVIMVAALFVISEPIIGYGIEPLLYGHSTGLSPLSVIVAAVFWTWIWGPVGLVLSMPLTLCLVVLGRHVPSLEFIDVLLGDRPALTPVESFYQRMVAGDPDEAIEQAETLLKERSLTAYYDEVALGGLKLAAEDARRGLVDHQAATRIVAAMIDVVHELDGQDETSASNIVIDRDKPLNPVASSTIARIPETAPVVLPNAPETWRADGTISFIAGRGILDDAVTAMLEQLLQKRQFGVRRVRNAAVARDAVAKLDLSGSRLICLSYLEIGGNPTHLRLLIRRLRRAAPAARILVGLWPEGEKALTDREIQLLIGADDYVASFGQAVEQCLRIAHDQAGEEARATA